MSRKIYFDMSSGFSGDMGLASVISLGADANKISDRLSSILKFNIELSIEKLYRNAVYANRLIIKTERDDKIFRGINEIIKIIGMSDLSESVKQSVLKTFNIIAEAEAEVHGIPIAEVHFHEIGAVDTIIDIVGFFYGLELLGVEGVFASRPIFGYGTVKTEHGVIPLPAPATLKILEGVSCRRLNLEGEFTTPTGAAILKTAVIEFSDSFSGNIVADRFITGSYEFPGATNLLRTIIFDDANSRKDNNDNVIIIETNIDKMTGEEFGSLYDRLMKLDLLDITYTPIFMKKNRPAYKLSIMTAEDKKVIVINTIFKYSESIGLRISKVDRYIMSREILEVLIEGIKVRVKKSSYNDIVKFQPEWNDIVTTAERLNITTKDVERLLSIIIDKRQF